MGIEALRMALSGCRLLFLDTMVFSYHLGDHPDYVPATTLVLSQIENGDLVGLTTTLTIAELLTRPAQMQDVEAMLDYRLYLTNMPHLEIVPLDLALAEETALVRAATRLKMPDAIQVAAAKLHGADAILTNDREWASKLSTPRMLILDDYR
jgi:predicted nucleic acid-binding protein